MHEPEPDFRSGYIAIVGAPNAGKSTLLNHLLGQKIAITSNKPQTTRNRILGVVHRTGSQMVFFDTPGIHRSDKPLNYRMVDGAVAAMGDTDLVLVMVDAASPDKRSENLMIEKLVSLGKPAILALNKIDLLDKSRLLPLIHSWKDRYAFEEIIPISAKDGIQTDLLLDAMETRLPPGPPFYPEDMLTDLPMRFLVAELIREKVFRATGDEIPYSVAVGVDIFEKEAKRTYIEATIHVERNSQKGIIIGKKGQKLKEIGEKARLEIEALLEDHVYLKLFVRVQKKWSSDIRVLQEFGY